MSILGAVGELERAFDELKDLFPNKDKFEMPIITVQSQGRKSAFGWFCENKWQDEWEKRQRPEINISAEYLSRPILDIIQTLIHEMTHYSNNLDGIKDCSPNQYHNKKFAIRCQEIGLIAKSGYRGWSNTELSPELRERILSLDIREDAFALFRDGETKRKAPTKLNKWRCGCTNARVATDFAATCLKCNQILPVR
jgi:hypothetical protein